jgi:hypothetical protein
MEPRSTHSRKPVVSVRTRSGNNSRICIRIDLVHLRYLRILDAMVLLFNTLLISPKIPLSHLYYDLHCILDDMDGVFWHKSVSSKTWRNGTSPDVAKCEVFVFIM